MRTFFFPLSALLFLAGCQANPIVVESMAMESSPSQNMPKEWTYSLPEPKELETFTGLKLIEEFVPEIDLRLWVEFRCGGIIMQETEPEPNLVNLEFRGSIDRWVPIDGKVTRTLHFEISR